MATTITTPAIFSIFPSSSSSSLHKQPSTPNCHLPFSRSAFFTPISTPKHNPRLRLSHKDPILWKHTHVGPFCCSGNAGVEPDTNDEASKESSINLQLPRRSLLVQFTCNACGERTKRMVNRLAYERGTVFVQCSGCLQHHKLVDNLGLVVEYDFRAETNED